MKYFLDANIISYVIKRDSERTRKFNALLSQDGAQVSVPFAAYYEVKRGLLSNGATTKLRLFDIIMQMLPVISLNRDTGDIAASVYTALKKDGILIEDADIFIAASAIEADAVLVTNNAKHMQRIEGLIVETWS